MRALTSNLFYLMKHVCVMSLWLSYACSQPQAVEGCYMGTVGQALLSYLFKLRMGRVVENWYIIFMKEIIIMEP
jgi:uncharacterized membrane protein YedE/YeeE